MIQYFEKGKLIKTEIYSKKTGELVKITNIYVFKRSFQLALPFKYINQRKLVNTVLLGIVTIFYSLLV